MVPTQRSAALALAIWLTFSRLCDRFLYAVTSDRFKKRCESILFISLVVLIIFLIALWGSVECKLHDECLITNASLANLLFGE